MKTNLEDFIRENREELDAESPSSAIWGKVAKRLQSPTPVIIKKLPQYRWMAAASILVLLSLVTYFLLNRPGNSTKNLVVTDTQASDTALLNEINPTYAKEVYHITQLIELKQSEIKQLEKEYPDLYKQFIGDVNKLDSAYHSLKQELPNNPNGEKLLEVMIQNLKLQMDLLNQQLSIIQQIKQSKNKKNESNSKNL